MVLWVRGRIVPYMRLYHAIFSGRPLASHAQVARIQSMSDLIEFVSEGIKYAWFIMRRGQPFTGAMMLFDFLALVALAGCIVGGLIYKTVACLS